MSTHYFLTIEPNLIDIQNRVLPEPLQVKFVEENIDKIVTWYKQVLFDPSMYEVDKIISITKIDKSSILIEFTKDFYDEDKDEPYFNEMDEAKFSAQLLSDPDDDCNYPLVINGKEYFVYPEKNINVF